MFFFSVFSFNYQSVLGYHGFYGEFSMFWFRLTSTLLVLSRGKQKERRGDPIGREKGPANRIGPNWFTGFYFIYIFFWCLPRFLFRSRRRREGARTWPIAAERGPAD